MSNADTIQAICDHANQVIASLPTNGVIDTEAAFDDALASAADGAVLILANSFQYSRPLDIPKPITLKGESYSPNNTSIMGWDEPAPTFNGGIIGHMHDHALLGIAMKGTETVGVMGGENAIWDRCRLLGDAWLGARRGIQWTGINGFLRRTYIDDIFRVDQDTQAICGWDSGPGLVIDTNYLSAAGQAIMFGGGDSSSPDRMPRVIWGHHNTLTKKAGWCQEPYNANGLAPGNVSALQQCKCAIEFKCCMDALFEHNDFQYGGIAMGQGYYLIVATVRNQDGAAPWSCVKNIEVRHCTGSHASGVCNFLGTDTEHPSDVLDNFNLHDCQFNDLDGSLGAGRVFLFGDNPRNVKVQNVKVTGVNMGATGYFYGEMPTGLVLTGLEMPPSEYGWIIDGDGSGPDALKAAMPDIVIDDTVHQ